MGRRPQPDRKGTIEEYHAQLAREFAQRKCSLCNAPATVVCVAPGQAKLEQLGIVLQRGMEDRNYCLRCMSVVDNAVARANA